MNRIHIKRVFPENLFTNRSVKLNVGDQKIIRIRAAGEEIFECEEEHIEITAKLDWYRSKKKVGFEVQPDRYFILRLRGHSIFEHTVLSLTPSLVQLLEVDRETYQDYSIKIYDSYVKASDHSDEVSFGMTMILAVFFFSQSIISDSYPENLKELMMISGLLGLITALVIRYDGKRISLLDARLRYLSTSLLFLAGVIWMAIEGLSGAWLFALPIFALVARNFGMLIVKPESELS
jgi:hypothetical protein